MAVKRTTSVSKEAELHENANSLLAVPKLAGPMSDEELEYFYCYADAKAMDDWFPHEPLILVQLAKLSVRLRDLTEYLEAEGPVATSPTGKETRSALAMECDALLRQQLAMMRTLNLSSSIRQQKANTVKRAVKEKGVRNKVKSAPTSLLAIAR